MIGLAWACIVGGFLAPFTSLTVTYRKVEYGGALRAFKHIAIGFALAIGVVIVTKGYYETHSWLTFFGTLIVYQAVVAAIAYKLNHDKPNEPTPQELQAKGRHLANALSDVSPKYAYTLIEVLDVGIARVLGVALDHRSLTEFTVVADGKETHDIRHSHFELAKVLEVTLDKHESRTTASVGQSKPKGALTRAAVGGFLLGPAGAIIGAATASRNITVTAVDHVSYHGTELTISTGDHSVPIVRFKLSNHSDAEIWKHRLLSLMQAAKATASPTVGLN